MTLTEINTPKVEVSAPQEDILPSGETRLEAAARYYAERKELAKDPNVSPTELEAKKATADLLFQQAQKQGIVPAPTGEPNHDFEPPKAA